ncbi:MAG: phospholipase D-like domain-containing protein [Myxococcaceae bacterium]
MGSGGESLSFALYQSVGVEMAKGHKLQLLENGEIWDELVEAIVHAESSIHIVTFIWRDGDPSNRLIAALKNRKPGVACRVVVDPFGSIGFDDSVRRKLSDVGCDSRVFRMLDWGPRTFERNHRKIVVVDGRIGFTGGFCIHYHWLGDGMHPEEWRDTHVRVEGPTVRDMQLAFSENWQEAGGSLLPKDVFPPDPPDFDGSARAAFVKSSTTANLSDAERMILISIAAAKRRLWISNAYFVPSTAIGDMLIQKVKEGVDVRVLAPGRIHDQPPVLAAQRSIYARMLESGVRIWEYQPSMMHSKTMIIDDRLAIIGSVNMDPLSLKMLEEGSLLVEDPQLVKTMSANFEHDLVYSLEFRWSWWRKRGLLERLGHQLAGLIGRWL